MVILNTPGISLQLTALPVFKQSDAASYHSLQVWFCFRSKQPVEWLMIKLASFLNNDNTKAITPTNGFDRV